MKSLGHLALARLREAFDRFLRRRARHGLRAFVSPPLPAASKVDRVVASMPPGR